MMMVARKLKKKVYEHNPAVCIKESCIHRSETVNQSYRFELVAN